MAHIDNIDSGDSSLPQADPWTAEAALANLPFTTPLSGDSPIPFLHLIEQLKTSRRAGWLRFGIDDRKCGSTPPSPLRSLAPNADVSKFLSRPESIADHMYRMGVMALLAPASLREREPIDVGKCVRMAVVHDLAEALVGDITPKDGIDKKEKSRRERSAMELICSPNGRSLLGSYNNGTSGAEILALWEEYEAGESADSRFVKDLDKVELLSQMVEYERAEDGAVELDEFSGVARRVKGVECRKWALELLEEREAFWRSKGLPRSEDTWTAAKVTQHWLDEEAELS